MKELKVGERVTIEAVEQDGCDGCFFFFRYESYM